MTVHKICSLIFSQFHLSKKRQEKEKKKEKKGKKEKDLASTQNITEYVMADKRSKIKGTSLVNYSGTEYAVHKKKPFQDTKNNSHLMSHEIIQCRFHLATYEFSCMLILPFTVK